MVKQEEQVKYTSMYLRHDFTNDEQTDMQKRLATQTQALRHRESCKKAAMAQFGSEIQIIDVEVGSLADKINSGYEHREMKCVLDFDWDKNKKYAVHPETGEVVGTFEITEDDRQLKFSMGAKKK